MALGILLIVFVSMVVISGLGIALLFLVKNPAAKNVIFYSLAIWAMGITFINASSLPSNYLGSQLMAWALGFIAIIGVVIKIKNPEKINIAKLLVVVSIVLSLLDLFF